MNCPQIEQLQRYYDGELPAVEREALETHLAACAACTGYLAQLRGMSQMLLSVDLPEFSAGLRQRTLNAVRGARTDLGVRHLAEVASAIAAVIIVGLMILPAQRSTHNQTAQSTETIDAGYIDTVAVTPPVIQHDRSNAQLVQFAQWMAGDVSADAR